MLAALIAYVIAVGIQTSFRNSDWPGFYMESILLRLDPSHLYDPQAHAALQLRVLGSGNYGTAANPALLPFNDPPWVPALVVPFAALGLQWGGVAWALLQLVTLFLGLMLLARDRTDALYATVTIPTWVLLANANVVGLVVLGLGLCWRLRSKNEWIAGLALGLALIRPDYLIPLPFAFALTRRWRLLGGSASALAILLAASEVWHRGLLNAWSHDVIANAGRLGADLSPAGIGWVLGHELGWVFSAAGLVAGLAISRARGPALFPACILAAPHALMQSMVVAAAGLAAGARCGPLQLALLNLGSIALLVAARSFLAAALLGTAFLLAFALLLRNAGDVPAPAG